MPAVSTMILNSLIALGEKSIDGTLTSTESTYFLGKLNSMMDSWSIQRLMCYSIVQESFALTSGTGSYTIGSGGDFNTVRPNKITYAFVRYPSNSSNMDTEVKVLPYDSYDHIVNKSVGNSIPQYLFYDAAYTGAGLATIRLYPYPQGSLTLFIDSWKSLQTFVDVSTALLLPPGYQRAIESNFAIEAAPGFMQVSAELAKIAKDSKAAIQSLNLPDTMMRLDDGILSGSRRGSSILTGP